VAVVEAWQLNEKYVKLVLMTCFEDFGLLKPLGDQVASLLFLRQDCKKLHHLKDIVAEVRCCKWLVSKLETGVGLNFARKQPARLAKNIGHESKSILLGT